jgi:hypothetical protein
MEGNMKNEKKTKTFRYTVSFTVETAREMDTWTLEEKAAAVWDSAPDQTRKPFTDSYGFSAVKR